MKRDIKKFIDILFEPDETVETPEEIEEVNQKAKSVLYQKKDDKKSAFIDLNETKKAPKEKKITKSEEYEISSQISPIFGLLKDKEKPELKTTTTDEKIFNKPEGSHLDIITSPIYGYAKKDEEEEEIIPTVEEKVEENADEFEFYQDEDENELYDDDLIYDYELEVDEPTNEELHILLDDDNDNNLNQEEEKQYSLFDSYKEEE